MGTIRTEKVANGRTWSVRVDEEALVNRAVSEALEKAGPGQTAIRRFGGALVAFEVPTPAAPETEGE